VSLSGRLANILAILGHFSQPIQVGRE